MTRRSTIALLALLCGACQKDPAPSSATPTDDVPALTTAEPEGLDPDRSPSAIAFGSCLDQSRPAPILTDVVAAAPDAMVLLGDNVYADAGSVADLERAYAALGAMPVYQRLAAAVPVLATWDDHDYGRNDVGKEFELKADSKRVMLDFFGEPADSPRRMREGNYDAVVLGPEGERVQVLLLDTRWFRDPLVAGGVAKRYIPHEASGPTVLGEAQWAWLEERLREPADVRFLVSSIQLIVGEHPFESWGLFPAERRRMFDLLAKTRAGGVIVVSGDRHRGELSCAYDEAVGYPLLELTASSLNRPNHDLEDNRFRIEGLPLVGEVNFGVARFDWARRSVGLALHGLGGEPLLEATVPLDVLQPGHGPEGVPGCEPLHR